MREVVGEKEREALSGLSATYPANGQGPVSSTPTVLIAQEYDQGPAVMLL